MPISTRSRRKCYSASSDAFAFDAGLMLLSAYVRGSSLRRRARRGKSLAVES
jgi:hypothetical protein